VGEGSVEEGGGRMGRRGGVKREEVGKLKRK
jgi:hypothetical protein